MQCTQCGGQNPDYAQTCQFCGRPLPQSNNYGNSNQQQAPQQGNQGEFQSYGSGLSGYNEPRPEQANPKGPFTVGDLKISIEGDLVPVVNVELGNQQSIYFEHHTLLWKHPNVQIGFKAVAGAVKRFIAGLQVFISEAQGPGNIAFSRESVGQIIALKILQGQEIDVREHQFLLATSNIEYGYTFVQGLSNILFSRTGLFVDRFSGRNGDGLLILHGYGNVFEKQLQPGEVIDIEPGAWLWKDASVQMTTTTVMGSTSGGIFGAIGNMAAGASITLNRMTGPGRVGIQSMTYELPTDHEGAQQTGGNSNLFGTLGQLFNSQ